MDVLVLGGSVFLGRAMVNEALAAGHDVTVFNRGLSGAAPAGVTQLVGDRTTADGLDALRGRQFDLVVDTCGYVAADVARSADLLADAAGFYAFVSSISVFPGWPAARDYRAAGVHDGHPGRHPRRRARRSGRRGRLRLVEGPAASGRSCGRSGPTAARCCAPG